MTATLSGGRQGQLPAEAIAWLSHRFHLELARVSHLAEHEKLWLSKCEPMVTIGSR
jgi:hypothetical protein